MKKSIIVSVSLVIASVFLTACAVPSIHEAYTSERAETESNLTENSIGNEKVRFSGFSTEIASVTSSDNVVYSAPKVDVEYSNEISVTETEAPDTVAGTDSVPETTASMTETEISETSAPETVIPETKAPETNIPETNIPETSVPETSIPETNIPETSVPGTSIPETSVPGTSIPETNIPETSVPETEETIAVASETTVTAEDPAPDTAAGILTEAHLGRLRQIVLKRINTLRLSLGANELSLNATLASYAAIRSNEVSVLWSHTRPSGTRGLELISPDKFRGENLAKTYACSGFSGTDEELSEIGNRIADNWIASAGHYMNLVKSEYTFVGIETYVSEINGNIVFYTAAMFSN